MTARSYDVVVLGATGFVGKLVCEQLAAHYEGKIRWAIAARNRSKMENLQQDLRRKHDWVKDVPLLVGDVTDPPSVEKILSQTKVVISLNGPYAKLGTPVVEACIKCSTHYCDITGEVQWIRHVADKYHDTALEKGVKIVHCCGFDSIPSDLGTLFVADHIKNTLGRPCKSVQALVGNATGGVSGGTFASLLGLFDEPAEVKAVADPYCLDPPGSRRGPDESDSFGVHYNYTLKAWTAPFIMSPINTRVVRRSNALLGHSYGQNFAYREAMQMPNVLIAALVSFLTILGGFIAQVTFFRRLLTRLLPSPGAGPSRKQLEAGDWDLTVIGTSEEVEGSAPRVVIAHVSGLHDPGYLDTSRFVAEAGICLATQADECAAAQRLPGGVLTAASAMGMVLVRRLIAAGFKFEIQGETRDAKSAS